LLQASDCCTGNGRRKGRQLLIPNIFFEPKPAIDPFSAVDSIVFNLNTSPRSYSHDHQPLAAELVAMVQARWTQPIQRLKNSGSEDLNAHREGLFAGASQLDFYSLFFSFSVSSPGAWRRSPFAGLTRAAAPVAGRLTPVDGRGLTYQPGRQRKNRNTVSRDLRAVGWLGVGTDQ
jgi:hypothetical protein